MENVQNAGALEQLCLDLNVKYQDVLDLLDLYDMDDPEDEILSRISTYPESARKLVTMLILPG